MSKLWDFDLLNKWWGVQYLFILYGKISIGTKQPTSNALELPLWRWILLKMVEISYIHHDEKIDKKCYLTKNIHDNFLCEKKNKKLT